MLPDDEGFTDLVQIFLDAMAVNGVVWYWSMGYSYMVS